MRASPANCEAAVQLRRACGTIVKSSDDPSTPAADFAVVRDELIELRERETDHCRFAAFQLLSMSLARLYSRFAFQ